MCTDWQVTLTARRVGRFVGVNYLAVWRPPEACMLKCNIDVAYDEVAQRTGIAWIVGDNYGGCMDGKLMIVPMMMNSLMAEAFCMKEA